MKRVGQILGEVLAARMKLGWPAPDQYEPTYAPPYDSPIENTVAWYLPKYLREDARLCSQVPIRTRVRNFRVDFLVEAKGRLVVIECDGSEYHDRDSDLVRDAFILGEGHADAVCRLPGSAIWYDANVCMRVLLEWEPSLFSERGRINVRQLTSDTLSNEFSDFSREACTVTCTDPDQTETRPREFSFTRRCRPVASKAPPEWQRVYNWAQRCRSAEFEALVGRSRRTRDW
jgi:very-short-patch-repair endonuclease